MTYFRDFVKLTVRYAYVYTVYVKSHLRVSPDLVEGNFETNEWRSELGVRLIIECDLQSGKYGTASE